MAAKKQKRFSLSALWRQGQIWAVTAAAVGEARKRAHSLLTDDQIATALMHVPITGGGWDLRPALDGARHATVGGWLRKHGWAELRRLALTAEAADAEIDARMVESILSGEQDYMAGLDAVPRGGLTTAEVTALRALEVVARMQESMLTLIDLYLSVAQYHVTANQTHRSLCPLCWRVSATRTGGLCLHHSKLDRVAARRDERALQAAGGWRGVAQRVTPEDVQAQAVQEWDAMISAIDVMAPDAYRTIAAVTLEYGLDRILLLPWRARRAVLEQARRRLVLYQTCRRLARERLAATHTQGETRGQVVELMRDGLSQAEVARRLGVSRQRVSVLVREIREEGE